MSRFSVFITGISSGLGKAFAEYYLARGCQVYGLSRRGSGIQHPALREVRVDLGQLDHIEAKLRELLQGVQRLDLVILNAGILGEIQAMHTLQIDDLRQLMDVNVWSNKLLLDYLCESNTELHQVVAISSGAAVNGNKGWGAYSLSKATLNMLIKLYAAEYPRVHFIALAPGLVDTAMQDHLCDPRKVDEEAFPSVRNLRSARGTAAMPGPAAAASTIAGIIPGLMESFASGEFVDVRKL